MKVKSTSFYFFLFFWLSPAPLVKKNPITNSHVLWAALSNLKMSHPIQQTLNSVLTHAKYWWTAAIIWELFLWQQSILRAEYAACRLLQTRSARALESGLRLTHRGPLRSSILTYEALLELGGKTFHSTPDLQPRRNFGAGRTQFECICLICAH